VLQGAALRMWWSAAMDSKNNNAQACLARAGDGAVASAVEARLPIQRSAIAHATALRSVWLSGLLGECRGVRGQAVAGRFLFWRGRRLPGAPAAPVVDPGLRPRFFSVLPTLCSFRAR
jgi:hypothetical protein